MRYLNGKPKACLYLNEAKYNVSELAMTNLEFNTIVRDTIAEHEIVMSFTNDTGMDVNDA
jgi:hypothetical protein